MSLEAFNADLRAALDKNKLSDSKVKALVAAALEHVVKDAQLVATLFRNHKKASAAAKLPSLYVIDAIARDLRSRLKKAAKDKGKEKEKETPEPEPGQEIPGTDATFMAKLEQVISKIVVENWENGLREHREKVKKILDIWTKAGTFSASILQHAARKLVEGSVTDSPSVNSPFRDPVKDLLRSPATHSNGTPPPPAAPTGIPANVRALMAAAPTAPAPAPADEFDELDNRPDSELTPVERAIRDAKFGSKRPQVAPPNPPSVKLDHAQLALLGQLAASNSTPPPQQSFTPPYQQHQQQQRPGGPANGWDQRPGGQPPQPPPVDLKRRWDAGEENNQPYKRPMLDQFGRALPDDNGAPGWNDNGPPHHQQSPPIQQQPQFQPQQQQQPPPQQQQFQQRPPQMPMPTQGPPMNRSPPRRMKIPFNPATFKVDSIDSWLGLADWYKDQTGHMPSTDEMKHWIQNGMMLVQAQQMMMAAAMQNGGMGGQGMMGGGGPGMGGPGMGGPGMGPQSRGMGGPGMHGGMGGYPQGAREEGQL